MAEKLWLGTAKAVPQLNTITPGSVDIGDTFTVTINLKAITFTATAATVANVTAGLVALLEASDEPEFSEVTWTDNTTNILATGPADGTPFTQTSSSSGGTLSTTTTTTPTGPNWVSNAANWSENAVPAAADNIVIDNTDVSLLYGTLSNAPTSITVGMAFTGAIGLPARNPNGYAEYSYGRRLSRERTETGSLA